MVANLADDRAADGRNIHAVIDRDMQVDIDPAVGRFGHLYAARLVFASEQMRQSVRHRADGHALYAEAERSCVACNAGENLGRDFDVSEIGLDRHKKTSLRLLSHQMIFRLFGTHS